MPLRWIDSDGGKPYGKPGLAGAAALSCRNLHKEIAGDALSFHERPQAWIFRVHNVPIPGGADNNLGLQAVRFNQKLIDVGFTITQRDDGRRFGSRGCGLLQGH